MSYSHLPLNRRLRVWRHQIFHWWRAIRAAKYTGLGEMEIRRIPDDDLVWRVFDYIFHNRMTFDEEQLDYDTSELNPAEKAVWYAWNVDCEVINGGFNQYFFNKRSRPTQPILEAYKNLGAEDHYQLFLKAIQDYGHVMESHISAIKQSGGKVPELLEAFSTTYQDNPLNDHDSSYDSIKPSIEDVLRKYIRNNPDDFKRNQ